MLMLMKPGADWLRERIHGEDLAAVQARWIEMLVQRSWKLRQAAQSAGRNGPTILQLLQDRCLTFLEALSAAMTDSSVLAIGAPEYREAVQHLSFAAGWMAGVGLPISDAVALAQSLQECLTSGGPDAGSPPPRREPPTSTERFFQALMIVVTEAYAASLDQRALAKYRDAMEKSQLVCDLHPQLPFLFLVGDPDRHALEDAVGRVMMLAAMREASVVVVDGAGLIWPDRVLPEAVAIIEEHGRSAGVKVIFSGVPASLRRGLPVAVVIDSIHGPLVEAVSAALAAGGLDWPSGLLTERRAR